MLRSRAYGYPLASDEMAIEFRIIERGAPILIWLNGAINSGKTATARELQKLLPKTAHVEVDSLNAFIDWMPLHDSIPIDLDNAVAVATVFFSHGLNVVVTYPLSTTCYERVVRRGDTLPFRFFTLKPSLDICLRDRGQRLLSDWERQRISFHYNGGIRLDIGVVIDNSCMTVAECASEVLTLSAA
jgi:chloramphenicol 3-O-phosphotransferase